jgi:hypothetical protein
MMDGTVPPFLKSALGGRVSDAPALLGSRAGLDTTEKRKILPLLGAETQPSCPWLTMITEQKSKR